MGPEVYQIHIRKEALKFSSAHMTVFPDRTKEGLHGHNYTTDISFSIQDVSFKNLISFAFFKDQIAKICDEWDSKVLIARDCPFLEIQTDTIREIEFYLCGKRYVLPRDEVVLLEVENISVECLADLFCKRLLTLLDPRWLGREILGVRVRIDETSGQGATASWSIHPK